LGEVKIPSEYFIDFLRGHLDGDGSIFTYEDRYNHYQGRIYTNQRVYIKFISASKNHILWLHNSIQTIIGIKGSITCHVNKGGNRNPMWSIKFAKKESIRLLPLIYYKTTLPCLERKKILTTQILKMNSQEKRKKYTKIYA
jgi:intein/homing endonuclease